MKKFMCIVAIVCSFCSSTVLANKSEPDPNSYAEKFPTIPTNARIVLLPMAYDFGAVSPEVPLIQEAIINHIKILGFTPVKVKLDADSNPKGIDRLFALPNLARKEIRPAKQAFLLDLKNQAPYDIALIPAVVSHTAKLSGQTAIWDHVKTRLEIKGFGSGMSTGWSGTSRGLSLELDAYDTDGNWLFTSYGGISLPYIINTRDAMNDLKPHLFESKKDQESLENGIEAAFEPLTKKIKTSKP